MVSQDVGFHWIAPRVLVRVRVRVRVVVHRTRSCRLLNTFDHEKLPREEALLQVALQ